MTGSLVNISLGRESWPSVGAVLRRVKSQSLDRSSKQLVFTSHRAPSKYLKSEESEESEVSSASNKWQPVAGLRKEHTCDICTFSGKALCTACARCAR